MFVLAGYALGACAEGLPQSLSRARLVLTATALVRLTLTVVTRLRRRQRYGRARFDRLASAPAAGLQLARFAAALVVP